MRERERERERERPIASMRRWTTCPWSDLWDKAWKYWKYDCITMKQPWNHISFEMNDILSKTKTKIRRTQFRFKITHKSIVRTSTKHNTEPSNDPATTNNAKNLQSMMICIDLNIINKLVGIFFEKQSEKSNLWIVGGWNILYYFWSSLGEHCYRIIAP